LAALDGGRTLMARNEKLRPRRNRPVIVNSRQGFHLGHHLRGRKRMGGPGERAAPCERVRVNGEPQWILCRPGLRRRRVITAMFNNQLWLRPRPSCREGNILLGGTCCHPRRHQPHGTKHGQMTKGPDHAALAIGPSRCKLHALAPNGILKQRTALRESRI